MGDREEDPRQARLHSLEWKQALAKIPYRSDHDAIVEEIKQLERLIAAAPPTIAGKLEVRGIGIVDMECTDNVPVALIVELTSDIQRLPDDSRERLILGIRVPLISIDAMTASAPSKVALALDRMGLKF